MSGCTIRLGQRIHVGESQTALFVATDNCRLGKVGHELVIGSLSNTSLPLLMGLFACLPDLIDASVFVT
jgi:hypothetical protein